MIVDDEKDIRELLERHGRGLLEQELYAVLGRHWVT